MTENILSSFNATMDEVRTISHRMNNPAEFMQERMMQMISHQQTALSPDQELGVVVTGGSAPAFYLRKIAFSNPDILIFIGRDAENNLIQVMQHHSQMSVAIIAMPKLDEKAYRIGFTTKLAE